MNAFLSALVVLAWWLAPQSAPPPGPAARLEAAVQAGTLAWRLSEPAEVAALLGPARSEETARQGGMEARFWSYSDTFRVVFGRQYGTTMPFVLLGALDGDRRIGLDANARLSLRTLADLSKLRPFTGLQNVDASRLDLRAERARLDAMPFDGRTAWPPADRLPDGYAPAALLEAGKNPGLGVRALHAAGVDGRGVTVAVIDQPLLRDHVEIAGRVEVLAELDVQDLAPEMHASAVTSLAVGRSCGVAPGARLCYVAVAMAKAAASNGLYIQALERLLEHNRRVAGADRVRAVSISDGRFAKAARADEWRALLARADAEGIFVMTADGAGSGLEYGLLRPHPGGDRERPDGYGVGTYDGKGLLVPGDGRTFAQHQDRTNYAYSPAGGMSWGPPYLAGLAALGFQVNPALTPARVRSYLVRSATRMPYGQVVNPGAFVRLCRDDPDAPSRVLKNGS